MKVNPYVAAGIAALISGLSVLNGAVGDGTLSKAELVSAAVALLTALGAALHIEPPRKGDAEGMVVVPMDAEPTDADETP